MNRYLPPRPPGLLLVLMGSSFVATGTAAALVNPLCAAAMGMMSASFGVLHGIRVAARSQQVGASDA